VSVEAAEEVEEVVFRLSHPPSTPQAIAELNTNNEEGRMGRTVRGKRGWTIRKEAGLKVSNYQALRNYCTQMQLLVMGKCL
jgi:hypothetical protein